MSLGTHRDYYLSTAKNELGVVYAKSLAGTMPVNGLLGARSLEGRGWLPFCMLLGADMTSRQQRQGHLLTAVLVCKAARQNKSRTMCICCPSRS